VVKFRRILKARRSASACDLVFQSSEHSDPANAPARQLPRDLSDAELVRALNARHPQAPRVALERLSPSVHAALWREFGNADELEDVEQEVFSNLFRDISNLRDPQLLRAYVLGITRNIVLAEHRSRRKRAVLSLEPDLSAIELSGRSGAAGASYALSRLTELLRRLRKRERATFVHRFIEGMTVNEVADVLGVSCSTVRRSLSRAWEHVALWASRDPYLTDYIRSEYAAPCE
jgi:RNA polymerase sigma-70 factor, ECF subfamily